MARGGLLAGVLLLVPLGAPARAADVIPPRIAKAAQDRAEAGEYPALVIGMVVDGQTQVAGYGKLPDGKAPDGDTVFEIGSATKTFTATLLADAVESGRVKLDEPLAKLLPGFTIPSKDGKEITLAEIGTQHSGLPRLPTNLAPKDTSNPYADYDAAKLKAFLASYELPRDPGAAYEYSNLGFGLLGFALATSEHTDYATLLRKRILDPLGMKSTGIAFTDAMKAHLAPGHDQMGKPSNNWDFDALAGCGAIRSTANDLLRYLQAYMGVHKTPLAAAMKLAVTPRSDVAPGERIGLAWMTRTTGSTPIVWHNGMTGAYASFVGFTADGKRGVVILVNAAISADDLGIAALDPTAKIAPAHKAIPMTADALEAYAGSYQISPAMTLRVFQTGGQLYAQATGQGAFPLFPSAPNEFFARVADISLSFTRDDKGAVTGLVLHQNGDHPASRLPDQPTVTLDAATLGEYVGKYQLAPGAVFDVTLKDGQLSAQLTGQPAFPVFPSAKDKFFYKVVDAQIDFERGSDGKVDALTLHQNGKNLRAPRIAQ